MNLEKRNKARERIRSKKFVDKMRELNKIPSDDYVIGGDENEEVSPLDIAFDGYLDKHRWIEAIEVVHLDNLEK